MLRCVVWTSVAFVDMLRCAVGTFVAFVDMLPTDCGLPNRLEIFLRRFGFQYIFVNVLVLAVGMRF